VRTEAYHVSRCAVGGKWHWTAIVFFLFFFLMIFILLGYDNLREYIYFLF
jgi:hypothetical protein